MSQEEAIKMYTMMNGSLSQENGGIAPSNGLEVNDQTTWSQFLTPFISSKRHRTSSSSSSNDEFETDSTTSSSSSSSLQYWVESTTCSLATSMFPFHSKDPSQQPQTQTQLPTFTSTTSSHLDKETLEQLSLYLETALAQTPLSDSSYLPELITFCVNCADLAFNCAHTTPQLTTLSSLVFDLLAKRRDLQEELDSYRLALWGSEGCGEGGDKKRWDLEDVNEKRKSGKRKRSLAEDDQDFQTFLNEENEFIEGRRAQNFGTDHLNGDGGDGELDQKIPTTEKKDFGIRNEINFVFQSLVNAAHSLESPSNTPNNSLPPPPLLSSSSSSGFMSGITSILESEEVGGGIVDEDENGFIQTSTSHKKRQMELEEEERRNQPQWNDDMQIVRDFVRFALMHMISFLEMVDPNLSSSSTQKTHASSSNFSTSTSSSLDSPISGYTSSTTTNSPFSSFEDPPDSPSSSSSNSSALLDTNTNSNTQREVDYNNLIQVGIESWRFMLSKFN